MALALAGGALRAQEPPAAREQERIERQRELEALKHDLERRRAAEERLKAEIESYRDDRQKFAQALLDTAARMKAIEGRLSAAEARLKPLDGREAEIRASLKSREAVLAEVLAAAARLSRRPAPAIMLQPEDALDSVRSAMLLGAIVPELRGEAETLIADLQELARVRAEIETERDTLAENRADLVEERTRLSALVAERQRRQAESEKALEAERARSQALARQVDTVTELIARIEKEIESAARAAAAARAAEERAAAARAAAEKAAAERAAAEKLAAEKAAAAKAAVAEKAAAEKAAAAEAARLEAERKRTTVASIPADPGRIAPAMPFAEAKGRLPLPVSGTNLRDFGAPDGAGGSEKGIRVATRPGTPVTAPCDGWVVYAGPFRSYGRLLIINGGGGYHVLLAGMEQITVELGQFVLAGEPVAVMGSGPRVASADAVTTSQPVLYIEFRKDGNPIDPAPWWAEGDSEKARG